MSHLLPTPRPEGYKSPTEIAEIVAGEAKCQDDWYPDWNEDEYRLWLEAQDDAQADGETVIVGRCLVCGEAITSDQYDRSSSHTQWNGCDVDLTWYRCECGASFVD